MSNNISEGLVACYAFNNNVNDLSGNGNNGDSNIEFVRDRDGNINSAGLFTSGKNVKIPGDKFNFQNDMTLSFWVKPYATQVGFASIFDKSHAKTASGWTMQMNGGNTGYFYFGFMQEASNTWSNALGDTYNILFPINVWSHIAVVKADNQISYYRNAQLITTETTSSAKIAISNPSYPLTIGVAYLYNNQEQSRQFNGLIDDIAIYDIAMTQSGVITLNSTKFQKSSSGSLCFESQDTKTSAPSTAMPTTAASTNAVNTTSAPSTAMPTTATITNAVNTTSAPSTSAPTTATITNAVNTTSAPSTAEPTTAMSIVPSVSSVTTHSNQPPIPNVVIQNDNRCTVDLSNTVINAPVNIDMSNCGASITYNCAGANGSILIITGYKKIILKNFDLNKNQANVTNFECSSEVKCGETINMLRDCTIDLISKTKEVTTLFFDSLGIGEEFYQTIHLFGEAADKRCTSSYDSSDFSSSYTYYLALGVITTFVLFEI